jgi:hypothetical protein
MLYYLKSHFITRNTEETLSRHLHTLAREPLLAVTPQNIHAATSVQYFAFFRHVYRAAFSRILKSPSLPDDADGHRFH